MSGFGIYIHWPYCARICPYCDFNVYRARGADHTPLLNAIIADIGGHAQRFGARAADTVFFGGGTPSLLSGADIEKVLRAVDAVFPLAADCEITIESNPEDAPRFAEHAAAGVNRFSIGVQALDDAALRALGRNHDVATARQAIETAAATAQRVSVDLIYAREGQSALAWEAELAEALALPVEHLSLYQLTVEPGTAFDRRAKRGQLAPPSADLAADLYETTQRMCEAAGFRAYEISNYARFSPARSRHNLLYWRGEEWIGVGPGAHGRMDSNSVRYALQAQRAPADYIDAVREYGVGLIVESTLTPEDAAAELVLMGLRIDEGVDLARAEQLRARPLNGDAIAWLAEQGLVRSADGRIALTSEGRILADKIAAEVLT
jgi:oxygen-independent coproporphyrinogen-3 oxidase